MHKLKIKGPALYVVAILLVGMAGYGAPGKKPSTPKAETRSDLSRRQADTEREITATRRKISANEQDVKHNLEALGLIESEIVEGKKRVDEAASKVSLLEKDIASLEEEISEREKNLALMRAEYLKAVKKMRLKRKENSMLAFILSSENFYQGARRMRYLKEFSNWRDAQSAEIADQLETLNTRHAELENKRGEHRKALSTQAQEQKSLEAKSAEQQLIVEQLKKDGDMLRAHLAQKQAEANALRNQVASIIAQEQAKAEAERKAREEQKRKDEAARRQREKEAAEQQKREAARQEALAKEAAKKETAKKEAAKKEAAKKEAAKKEAAKKEAAKKETAKKETPKKEVEKKDKSKSGGDPSFAEARKRRPKTPKVEEKSVEKEAPVKKEVPVKKEAPKAETKPSSGDAPVVEGNGFAARKGALPRPVDGSWKVVSRFGLHSMQGMANVSYDNPGIDVEVAKGATAKCVYAGKVSGVYVLPGYGTVVIVNHDGYYTVYGNLASTAVKVGDKVNAGTAIGRVGASENNSGVGLIHFEVWKAREKQDPLGWIR